MELPRVVPWKDWREWYDVKVALVGKDTSDAPPARDSSGGDDGHDSASPASPLTNECMTIDAALARVRMWCARGTVPVSVEATADLMTGLRHASHACSTPCLAMALVRMVNGLLDHLQGGRAVGLTHLANVAHMPRTLVPMRHALTHGRMPPAAEVRRTAVEAVQWLHHTYWKPQAASFLNASLAGAKAADAPSLGTPDVSSLRRLLRDVMGTAQSPATRPASADDLPACVTDDRGEALLRYLASHTLVHTKAPSTHQREHVRQVSRLLGDFLVRVTTVFADWLPRLLALLLHRMRDCVDKGSTAVDTAERCADWVFWLLKRCKKRSIALYLIPVPHVLFNRVHQACKALAVRHTLPPRVACLSAWASNQLGAPARHAMRQSNRVRRWLGKMQEPEASQTSVSRTAKRLNVDDMSQKVDVLLTQRAGDATSVDVKVTEVQPSDEWQAVGVGWLPQGSSEASLQLPLYVDAFQGIRIAQLANGASLQPLDTAPRASKVAYSRAPVPNMKHVLRCRQQPDDTHSHKRQLGDPEAVVDSPSSPKRSKGNDAGEPAPAPQQQGLDDGAHVPAVSQESPASRVARALSDQVLATFSDQAQDWSTFTV